MATEELTVDEIRATLVERHSPTEGDQGFDLLARYVFNLLSEGITDRIQTCLEAGFDATMDVDGPNYEVMAQLVYDRFVK